MQSLRCGRRSAQARALSLSLSHSLPLLVHSISPSVSFTKRRVTWTVPVHSLDGARGHVGSPRRVVGRLPLGVAHGSALCCTLFHSRRRRRPRHSRFCPRARGRRARPPRSLSRPLSLSLSMSREPGRRSQRKSRPRDADVSTTEFAPSLFLAPSLPPSLSPAAAFCLLLFSSSKIWARERKREREGEARKERESWSSRYSASEHLLRSSARRTAVERDEEEEEEVEEEEKTIVIECEIFGRGAQVAARYIAVDEWYFHFFFFHPFLGQSHRD